MTNALQHHFPMIQDRVQLLDEIQHSPALLSLFQSWEERYQQEFLDFCTGVRGLKLLYDSFFKAIFNPDITPERLERLLSLILKTAVKILKVLPNDSTRIAAESSLLVLDIVIQLADGSIANVEVQKIGYAFPGQRSACYSADLLLRQYKRVKGEKGKLFSYKDIKKVYTIVLFEKSTSEFHQFQEIYLHRIKPQSDTGIQIELLQEYVFIALDIFKKTLDNKNNNMTDELEAWLAFLSTDDPDVILKLIEAYPQFEPLYREVYEMCRDLERMMHMFSKELAELDKNTVQYMIDEMQDTIDEQKVQLNQKEQELQTLKEEMEAQKERELQALKKEIEALKKRLADSNV